MGRNTTESCMFCTPDPCTCFEKPKAKARPRLPASSVKPAAPSQVIEPRRTALTSTSANRAIIEEEKVFRQALTLLCESGIVSAASVAENAEHLDMSPVKAKLLIWKLRRQEWVRGLPKNSARQ